MSRTIRLEALVAWPPTSKCRETIRILEEVVKRYPDEVRLVVFNRGNLKFPEDPSPWMAVLIHKGSPVPTCVVDGTVFCTSQVPKLEELETRVRELLKAG